MAHQFRQAEVIAAIMITLFIESPLGDMHSAAHLTFT